MKVFLLLLVLLALAVTLLVWACLAVSSAQNR